MHIILWWLLCMICMKAKLDFHQICNWNKYKIACKMVPNITYAEKKLLLFSVSRYGSHWSGLDQSFYLPIFHNYAYFCSSYVKYTGELCSNPLAWLSFTSPRLLGNVMLSPAGWPTKGWKHMGAYSALLLWYPGAKAPGHQYPHHWPNIHCTEPVSDKKYYICRNNIIKWN